MRLAPPKGPDRGLAWFLALGVLRRRASVDAALRERVNRPLAALDPEVRVALRLGAFEVLHARTQRHAAVHQAVEVVRVLGANRAHGMVNAVLRRVEPPKRISRADRLDTPPWLLARWDARYGEKRTEQWCEANREPAPITVVVREDAGRLAREWAQVGVNVEAVLLHGEPVEDVLRLPPKVGHVAELPGYEDGAFWVQDPAAVAVADLVRAGEGMRVLDACAAPGGKALRLASRGAQVLGVDRDVARIEQLSASATRCHLPIETRAHNWENGPLPGDETFEAVLVDAPCTALGLVRRHPDIRWRRQLVDVAECALLQTRILRNAARHVAPGGVLVYAVCSPEPEEGDDVVRAFLEEHADYRLDSELLTAPPEGDEDAFYAARLVRR